VEAWAIVSANAPKGEPGASGSGQGNAVRFPRSARLLRHSDFERVYQRGKRHFSSRMTIFYLRREQGEGLRIGFTVGRALGGAVDRNRIRRRMREAVRLRRPVEFAAVDVVINPKRSVLKVAFDELVAEVGRGFEVIAQKLTARASER
jgi:ribonuclease P protein component